MSTEYHVYANTGAGDPIDYTTPVATVSATTWSPGPLAPGTWSFGVRAFDTVSGDEEENLDCAATIVIDADGHDVTAVPAPPLGLRAIARAAAGLRAEWYYPATAGPKAPTGFHVYCTAGPSVSYSGPAATVAYATGINGTFVANLSGLTGGTAYSVGVRAYNASGEEANTAAVAATADATGPLAVDSLVGSAIV